MLVVKMEASCRAGGLTNPASAQGRNQGHVLAQPNIHPTWDLLEHGEGVGILGL